MTSGGVAYYRQTERTDITTGLHIASLRKNRLDWTYKIVPESRPAQLRKLYGNCSLYCKSLCKLRQCHIMTLPQFPPAGTVN